VQKQTQFESARRPLDSIKASESPFRRDGIGISNHLKVYFPFAS
jgi:hypothetical protein